MDEAFGATPHVGLADIARLARVGPAAVSNWRRRHPSFPQPIGGTARSPRFALADVQAWLAAQGKEVQLPPVERAWSALDAARGGTDPVDLLAAVGLSLAGRPVQDGDHTGDDGVVGPFAGWRPPPRREIGPVVEALGGPGVGAGAKGDFEALCSRVVEGGARPGVSLTPPELAEAMVELLGPVRGTLLDPACGAASVLAVAAGRGWGPVLGQEIDPALARLAAARLALHGIEARIAVGDSFLRPAWHQAAVGAVVCHPPFGERTWAVETLVDDPRFAYGLPPRGEPELAWAQLALAAASPGGTAVVVMPPAAASRPSGRRIRRELVARGALAAVVSLPPGLAAHYALALQLWVLRHPTGGSGPNEVIMADAGEPAGSDWASVQVLVQAVSDAVHGTGEATAGSPGSDDPRVVRRVPVTEVLDGDGDLTPRRYLGSAAEQVPTVAELNRRCQVVSSRWATLDRAMTAIWLMIEFMDDDPAAAAPVPVPELTAPEVTVEDLVRSGSIAIRRRAPRGVEPVAVRSALIVTAADLARRRPPSQTGDVDADELRNPPIRSGDVLIPTIATQLRARVATRQDVGCYPGPGVAVLRPDPEVVDPAYLAGYLSSARGGRQADRIGSSGGGGALKVDVRRLRVPVPPIEAQRRWGAAFQHLESVQNRLRDAVQQGETVLQEVGDALAAWAARGAQPPEISHLQ